MNDHESQLQDLIQKDLSLVICGTAAGKASAERGAYYAGRGNKFWVTLHEVGLTDEVLRPEQYRQLLSYGIGLTDVAKTHAGGDREIPKHAYDPEALVAKLREIKPKVVCFNGKEAAKRFFRIRSVDFGEYDSGHPTLPGVRFFVAPSTSGAACGSWDLKIWRELADIGNCDVFSNARSSFREKDQSSCGGSSQP